MVPWYLSFCSGWRTTAAGRHPVVLQLRHSGPKSVVDLYKYVISY